MSPRFAFTPLPAARADQRKPTGLAALSGTWRGEFTDDAGAREAFTLLRDGSHDAAVAGRFLFFVSHHIVPTGVKLLEASANSFVALVGPYYDPRQQSEMILVLEGTRLGAQLEGHFYTRQFGGRDLVQQGRFCAVRADNANRAA